MKSHIFGFGEKPFPTKRFFIFRFFVLMICLSIIPLGSIWTGNFAYAAATGTVSADGGLNVRSGPGLGYSILGGLYDGAQVEIISSENGWYRIQFGSTEGYVSGEYIVTSYTSSGSQNTGTSSGSGTSVSTSDSFERSIAAFPETYKPFLRNLHAKYPNWKFVPQLTGLDWNTVIYEETHPVYINLVPSSWDYRYMSTAASAFDIYGNRISFDSGGYVAASEAAVKYYMDPRNFLNENSIFQFYSMKYDATTQTIAGVNSIIAGSFMSRAFPESTYPSYAHLIMEAGKQSGANPLTLASMLLQEQGYTGASGLISGTTPGYQGYYNFFNIGAYAAGGNSSVTNGLIYAKNKGWNSRTKAIIGGAQYFAQNYINAGQSTPYLKKFNVMNGVNYVGVHQYMTAVYAANSEGIHLKNGYTGMLNQPMTFEIPVYSNMPSTPCPVPTASSTSSSSSGSSSTSGTSGSSSSSGTSGTSGSSSSSSSSGTSGTSGSSTAASIVTTRISGTNRVKTSIATADKLKSVLNVTKFQNIVVASGESYPDALSGTYLATTKNAPILLVTDGSISEVTTYIKNNLASGGTVYILGGKKAVPEAFDRALGSVKSKRISGANRYETNLNILSESGAKKGDILVCSGMNFPDALSASAAGKPILLVGSSLTTKQLSFLNTIKGSTFYFVGGTSAISDSVFTKVASYGTAFRISGANRYSTSTLVSRRFFSGTQKNAVIAYGGNFPDGISAGPLAAKLKAPIILVSSGDYQSAKAFINSASTKNLYIMGGSSVVTDKVVQLLSK